MLREGLSVSCFCDQSTEDLSCLHKFQLLHTYKSNFDCYYGGEGRLCSVLIQRSDMANHSHRAIIHIQSTCLF